MKFVWDREVLRVHVNADNVTNLLERVLLATTLLGTNIYLN